MKHIKLLVVTRENTNDKRYGLYKSLSPVLDSLQQQQVDIRYLCQADLTPRCQGGLRRLHGWLTRLLRPFALISKTDVNVLCWALIERLNMGRVAANLAAALGYTHVHCHDPIIAAGFQWARRLRLRKNTAIRHGVTQHGFGTYSQALHEDGCHMGQRMMLTMRRWEARILKRANWVICPTDAGIRQLQRDTGVSPRPDHWHTITHPKFPLRTIARSQARQQLGWHDNTCHIISVGRLVPLKDFDTLLIAVSSLLPSTPWHLTILGDGDWNHWRKRAQDLGVAAERCTFAATDDISLWYRAADIYVSTSTTESFGMANHEAVCAELPCLLTAVAAVPEASGAGALLFPPGDPATLRALLESLILQPSLRQQLSRKARQFAAQWPTTDCIARAYVQAYTGQPVEGLSRATGGYLSPSLSNINSHALFSSMLPMNIEPGCKALVVAPHPDDETIAIGGTLLRFLDAGCEVHIVIITGDEATQETAIRQRELQNVLDEMGIKNLIRLEYPDGKLENTTALQEQIADILQSVQPTHVISPAPLDRHRDHVAGSLATARAWRESAVQCELYWFEFWAPLACTHYVDISNYQQKKNALIQHYQLPLSHLPYDDYSEHLAKYRGGLCSQTDSAECFQRVSRHNLEDLVEASLTLYRNLHAQ